MTRASVGFAIFVLFGLTRIDAASRLVRSPQFGGYSQANAQASAQAGGFGGPPAPPPQFNFGGRRQNFGGGSYNPPGRGDTGIGGIGIGGPGIGGACIGGAGIGGPGIGGPGIGGPGIGGPGIGGPGFGTGLGGESISISKSISISRNSGGTAQSSASSVANGK